MKKTGKDEERQTRRQERELRKLELEAELLKPKKAIETAKSEHELERARLGQGCNDTELAEVREDRAKAPKLPSFVDGKDDLDAYLQRFESLQLQLNGRRQDGLRKLVLFCLNVLWRFSRDYLRKQPKPG